MPIIHNNILCITFDELVECGVSSNTIKYGLQMQRKGLVYCWEHHKQGNKVYIHYDSLRNDYKLLITQIICDGIEPALWIENHEAEKLNRELDRLCNSFSNMIEVLPEEIKILSDCRLYTAQEVQQIARCAGWLRLWRKMDVKTARSYGFDTVGEINEELLKRYLNEQSKGFVKSPKPINTVRVMDRKAREYEVQGIDCLIAGYFGNANRGKIDTRAHAILMDLASNTVKFSFEDIGLIYNTNAEQNKLPRMTVSAIKQHLNKPKNKNIWYRLRHGKYATDILLNPQIERERPPFADALWTLDGTPMQLYYMGDDGKVKSDLYIYFVFDVYSSAIVGYSVAFTETMHMVAEALKNAIDTYGYKPYQLQYDGGSANVSGAIKGVMNNMSRVHFPCAPYAANGKYAEVYIGHFQQRVLRYMQEFKGGNITTKSLNSKANPELLKQLRTDSALKTEAEIIAMFDEAVKEWNSRGEKRNSYGEWIGETKIERYMHEHAERVQLNYSEKISLFMGQLPKPYEYTQQGITIRKIKYIVPDADGVGDFEFNRLHLGQKFDVRINPLNTDFITLYRNDKYVATAHKQELYASCVAGMKAGKGSTKFKLFVEKAEQYGYEHAQKEMERQRAIIHREEMRATGTDGFGGFWDMSKRDYNQQRGATEDSYNGIENNDTVDSKRRALLNM